MLHNRKILHHQSCQQTSEVFEIMEFMQLTRLQFVLCEPFLPMSVRYLFVLLSIFQNTFITSPRGRPPLRFDSHFIQKVRMVGCLF